MTSVVEILLSLDQSGFNFTCILLFTNLKRIGWDLILDVDAGEHWLCKFSG